MNDTGAIPTSEAGGIGQAGDFALSDHLSVIRDRIDSLLDRMPERRLDAKRLLHKELGFDPDAGQLNTILKMGQAPEETVSLQDMSRSTLALLALAESELREIFDSATLDPAGLDRSVQRMPLILEITGKLGGALKARIDMLDGKERDFAVQVGKSLLPAIDRLTAAALIAPRLLHLAQLKAGEERAEPPASFNDQDAALISGGPVDASLRCRITSMALRTLLQDDLDAWQNCWEAGGEEGPDPEFKQAILDRFERDVVAYQVVVGRIQQLQGQALQEGGGSVAASLDRAKQELFPVYREVAAALKQPDRSPVADPAEQGGDGIEELRAKLSSAEQIAAQKRKGMVSEEEIYLAALKKSRQQEEAAPAVRPGAAELKRERLRVRILSGIAGVMAIVAITVYAMMLGGGKIELQVPVSELPDDLTVISATAIGPMLYAKVSGAVWERLERTDKVRHVEELGRDAAGRGFETLYITDENHRDLARWTDREGVKLVE